MSLTFDPQTGLEAPDTESIREAVAVAWTAAFQEEGQPRLDTDSTTPAGQLIDAHTAEIEARNADTLYLAGQFNPRVAEGRWQDALGSIYFLTRKVAEPTIVTCQLSGLNGTAIPYGALVRNDDGRQLLCNAPVTIGAAPFASGRAETTFRVSETGPVDIPAGSVNTIVTTIPGWDGVSNSGAGAVGRDIETRADFEARRAASVAANAHGSVSAIFGTLSNLSGLEGVLDVQVLENIGPNPVVKYGVTVPGHGITVCIYGGAEADIARVLYEKKDAGCDTGGNTRITHTAADYSGAVYEYAILRPETVNFWVRARMGGSVTPSAREAIRQAVYSDFLGENTHTRLPRVGLAQEVYASRFTHAIAAVDEATGLLGVSIALAENPTDGDFADKLIIRGDQEPVISLDNIQIIET